MSKNFSLKELIASDTAKRKGIDNTPSFEVVEHLNELCVFLLEPIREYVGIPMLVTSGFRCPILNALVGGSPTSAHPLGWAVDIQIKDMSQFDSFVKKVKTFLVSSNLPFDQLLIEKSGKTRWLHIGYKNSKGEQRRIIKNIVL